MLYLRMPILFLALLMALTAGEAEKTAVDPERLAADTPLITDRDEYTFTYKNELRLYVPDVPVLRGFAIINGSNTPDCRDPARTWNFAFLMLPGGSRKDEHPIGAMVLDKNGAEWIGRFLAALGTRTKHPELANVPVWYEGNQNGPGNIAFVESMLRRQPRRLLGVNHAWSVTKADPAVFREAPYLGLSEGKELGPVMSRAPGALLAQGHMWNFGHGWFSKAEMYWFFTDRVIRARVPLDHDPRTGPTPLRLLKESDGWLCDYTKAGEWTPIAPFNEVPEADRARMTWMPDRYAACVWRAYQSRKPTVSLLKPTMPFQRGDGAQPGRANAKGERYSGGIGFGVFFPPGSVEFQAKVDDATITSVEFCSGDRVLAVAKASPWTATATITEPGIHALIAIGVRGDGTRTSSRPAGYVVSGSMWPKLAPAP